MGKLRGFWLWTAVLLAVPILAVCLLLLTANSQAGREWIAGAIEKVSSGAVRIEGLSGRLPDNVKVARMTIRDVQGPWLTFEAVELAWSPIRLLGGTVQVERLSAGRVGLSRLPIDENVQPKAEADEALPVAIEVAMLAVDRLDLAPGLAGADARHFGAKATLRLASLDLGSAEAQILDLDGSDHYMLRARMEPDSVQGSLQVQEQPRGLITSLAGLFGIGSLSLDAQVQGPRGAAATHLDVTAGAARLQVDGTMNLLQGTADLGVRASAPSMRPAEGLGWEDAALQATLRGPYQAITANGNLALRGLEADGVSVGRVALEWRGDSGRLHAEGQADGIRLPLPQPGLMEGAPVRLALDSDFVAETLEFAVQHPLLKAEGRVRASEPQSGEMSLRLPDLGPFAELGGLSLKGGAELRGRLERRGQQFRISLDGRISIPAGEGPLPALIGDGGTLQSDLMIEGKGFSLDRLQLRGRAVQAAASGGLTGDQLDLEWKLGLPDLKALSPGLAGRLTAQGQIKGPIEAFACKVEADGELAVRDLPKGPVFARLEASGLPGKARWVLKGGGLLAGSSLQLETHLERTPADAWRLSVERASWKSARASGSVALANESRLPTGKLVFSMDRLADLAPLLGQPLAGSIAGALSTAGAGGPELAVLRVEGKDLTLTEDLAGQRALIDVSAAYPFSRPKLRATVNLEGWRHRQITANARLDAAGPPEALELNLQGGAQGLPGGDFRLRGQGRLDLPASLLTLGDFEAQWTKDTLKLLQAARFRYGDEVDVDRLRLGWRSAELDLRGRISPSLDVEANLRGLPAALAGQIWPGLDLLGQVQAGLRLSGPPSAPRGNLTLNGDGLRARSGAGKGFPAARLQAAARLDGVHADVDAALAAGQGLNVKITGHAPLNEQGLFDLKGQGQMDLKLLDPLLTAAGRRARGRLALDAAMAGPLAEPRVTGRIALNQGEWQDYALGVHVLDLSGEVQAEGDTIRLTRLQGRPGSGTVAAQGSLALNRPGLPLDLRVTARKANVLSSERLQVNLDADVGLTGQLREQLTAAGTLRVNRAEIRIPERMPVNIAVLQVREPGVPPPPPPEPGPDLALDLSLSAPEAVFVRGRGLDAELAGKVHLGGSLKNLQPEGGFFLRRGQFSLAGQTLNFSRGVVGFDGGRITDPSLNFLAESSNGNVTAKLQVTGTAQKPKISLSSVPELPQDEVLAQLLFGRGSASLSPFELVQIASALASLAGITPVGGDALGGVRDRLGLDRLSFGGGGKGPTLEGGRYVAPGVYVGAKQGASLNSTQGMVQIDVAKGFKLEASVGTGSATGTTAGTSSVGVIYQFEY